MTDKELLLESVGWAAEREALITRRFYEILFARHPEVQPLFSRNAREAQAKMLQDAVVMAIDHMEDAAWLTDTIGAVGAKHVDYGVTDEMYPWVGEALVATMAEHCGARWTPAHEAAWVRTWGALQSLALAGAARRRAAG